MATPIGGGSADPMPPTVSITLAGSRRAGQRHRQRHRRRERQRRRGRRAVPRRRRRRPAPRTRPRRTRWPGTRAPCSNGAHTLTARARDAAGNSTLSAPVTVNVANASSLPERGARDRLRPADGDQVPARRADARRRAAGHDQGAAAAVHAARSDAVPAADEHRLRRRAAGDLRHRARSRTSRPTTTTTSSTRWARPNRDRLSRFTANASLTGTVAGSELVLYQDPQDANAEHHGGAINFGNDGKLYFTTGEHFDAAAAQALTQPARQDPPDQPGRHGPDRQPVLRRQRARTSTRSGRSGCATRSGPTTTRRPAGSSSATSAATTTRPPRRRSTSARAAPTTAGRTARAPARRPCTSPIYSYPHNGRDAAITGGFVYHGSQFPSRYQGSYFFADYTQNWIRRLTFDAERQRQRRLQLRAAGRLASTARTATSST